MCPPCHLYVGGKAGDSIGATFLGLKGAIRRIKGGELQAGVK
jgi:hypothetical protein